jgi:hypothetical protein
MATNGTRIYIVDGDRWEEHNFNRVPLPLHYVGENKAQALANYLAQLRPNVRLYAVRNYIRDTADMATLLASTQPNVVIDAVDNIRTTKMILEACQISEIYYVGAHYDGTHVTVEAMPPHAAGLWEVDSGAQGYQVFPSLAPAAAIAGSLAAFLAVTKPDKPVSIVFDLSELPDQHQVSSRAEEVEA